MWSPQNTSQGSFVTSFRLALHGVDDKKRVVMRGIIGIVLFIVGILLCDKTDAESDAIDAIAVMFIMFGLLAFIFWLVTDGTALVM